MLNLLYGLALVLILLWVLGFSMHFTLGGFIHVLLVLGMIFVLMGVIMGRRAA